MYQLRPTLHASGRIKQRRRIRMIQVPGVKVGEESVDVGGAGQRRHGGVLGGVHMRMGRNVQPWRHAKATADGKNPAQHFLGAGARRQPPEAGIRRQVNVVEGRAPAALVRARAGQAW